MSDPTQCPVCLSSEVRKLADGLFVCGACGGYVPFKPFTEAMSIEEIEALLPVDELDQLSAYGDERDRQRWAIGDKAREWIDDQRLPVGQICRIIGKRTDYGWERVKDFLYVSRFYYERPELREKYNLLRYSIFEHAKGCSDPEAVLAAAHGSPQMPIATIRENFPVLMNEFKDLYNRIPKRHEAEARLILETAIAKFRELIER